MLFILLILTLRDLNIVLYNYIQDNPIFTSIISYFCHNALMHGFKGALSSLRPFLATESPLKMMKNAFYFTSKALFVLKIFKFLS